MRLVVVTIADFAAGGAGSARLSSLVGGGAAGSRSSSAGGVSAGARRLALVTIAGPTIATAFRFRGDRFGRCTQRTMTLLLGMAAAYRIRSAKKKPTASTHAKATPLRAAERIIEI